MAVKGDLIQRSCEINWSRQTRASAVVRPSTRIFSLVLRRVHALCDSDLAKVAGTFNSIGAFASGVERWKKDGDQDGDDGYDDEKFDQREAARFLIFQLHAAPVPFPQN